MRAGRALALLLVAATAALFPLAYASPPDPVWASGIFDDDDGDNVVGLIVSATALVEPLTFNPGPPTPVVLEYPVQSRDALQAFLPPSSISARAPPSAASSRIARSL